jgi:hypothetical protein
VLAGMRHRNLPSLLALPLAVAGLGVAVFDEYLEQTGRLECLDGVMGLGTAPRQSLAALIVLLTVDVVFSSTLNDHHRQAAGAAVVPGLLPAWGAVVSATPMPR